MPQQIHRNPEEAISLAALSAKWLRISILSFGGGTSTLALIRHEFIEKRHLISDAEFTRDWALCQLAPGINLVAVAILLGYRLGGIPGAAVSLLGLLTPSVFLTLVLTALYVRIRDTPVIKHALLAVMPMIAGIGMATAVKMAIPVRENLIKAGRPCYWLHAALFVLIVVAAIKEVRTVWVLIGAAVVGAILSMALKRREEAVPSEA